MAAPTAIILDDAMVMVNSVDLSDEVEELEIAMSWSDVDLTNFGSKRTMERRQGLGDHSCTLRMHQDFTAALTDATLWPLTETGHATVVIKPSTAAVSGSNPSFTFRAVVGGYVPLSGTPGAKSPVALAWPISGTVARATT